MLRADFGPIVVRAGANVQDGSVLHGGDDPVTEIGPGATVAPGTVVPSEVVVTGTPAKVRGPLEGQARWWVEHSPAAYQELARRHRAGVEPAD